MGREDNIYFARLAEQAERYEDMVKYMKDVAMVSHPSNSAVWTRNEQRRKKSSFSGV
jgi:hypothetical protein